MTNSIFSSFSPPSPLLNTTYPLTPPSQYICSVLLVIKVDLLARGYVSGLDTLVLVAFTLTIVNSTHTMHTLFNKRAFMFQKNVHCMYLAVC